MGDGRRETGDGRRETGDGRRVSDVRRETRCRVRWRRVTHHKRRYWPLKINTPVPARLAHGWGPTRHQTSARPSLFAFSP